VLQPHAAALDDQVPVVRRHKDPPGNDDFPIDRALDQ
jgi:hypothetical protein